MALRLRGMIIFLLLVILSCSNVPVSQAVEEKDALVFKDALPFSEGLAAVCLDGKWGYINESGKIVIRPSFDKAEKFYNGVAVVWQNKKCGYIDNRGNIIIKPQFQSIVSPFYKPKEVDLISEERDGEFFWGSFNRKNKKLVLPTFNTGTGKEITFNGDFIQYQRGQKVGLVDSSLKELTPAIYDDIRPESEGYAVIKNDDKYGLIKEAGVVVVEPQYESLENFHEGLAAIRKDGKCGFINKDGRLVIPLVYDRVGNYSNGMVAVCQDKKWGVIDKSGQEILPIKYDWCWFFGSWELFQVSQERKVGLMDRAGVFIIEPVYDTFASPYKDLLPAKKDGKWGIVARSGQVILDFVYDDYRNGKICINGKWGYFDIKNQVMLLEPLYDDVEYSGEVFWVRINDKWGCLNKEGQMIISPLYDAVIADNKMPLTLLFNKQDPYPKWGVANRSGKILYEPQFDYYPFWAYTHFSPDMKFSVVAKDGKFGYITATGEWLGIQ